MHWKAAARHLLVCCLGLVLALQLPQSRMWPRPIQPGNLRQDLLQVRSRLICLLHQLLQSPPLLQQSQNKTLTCRKGNPVYSIIKEKTPAQEFCWWQLQDHISAARECSVPLSQRAEIAGFPICQPPSWLASQIAPSQTSSWALPVQTIVLFTPLPTSAPGVHFRASLKHARLCIVLHAWVHISCARRWST